jgi:uncharacterized protein YggT (Ycf19 family)
MEKLLPILSTLETTAGSKLGTGGSKIPTSSLDKISTITGGIAPAAEAPPSLANRIDPKEIGGGAGVGSGGIGGPIGGMMSGGMPCEFELTMEFVCYFVFTFIIYFCVFAFIPYDNIIRKIFKFIEKITKKFMDFINKLIPNSVKKRASKLFPKFIVNFFKKTIPALIKEKKEEITTPLKEKLEEIKKEAYKKLNKQRDSSGGKKDFISETRRYLNEQYIKITTQIKILWKKFNDKILPAIVISFIYYVIWLFFFKFVPTVLKYLINIALNFKNAQMGK